jgi:hypothetical protein
MISRQHHSTKQKKGNNKRITVGLLVSHNLHERATEQTQRAIHVDTSSQRSQGNNDEHTARREDNHLPLVLVRRTDDTAAFFEQTFWGFRKLFGFKIK